jgi:DNA invertase Pin-like site-specific DNA recombinase
VKLCGYVRVSTDVQAEKGLGVQIQTKATKRWAIDHGHKLGDVFTDVGASGTLGFADRPALAEALDTVHRGATDGLVVYRLDRLARLLTVQEAVLAQVWALGGTCFSVDTGEILRDDPDDPTRTALRQMIGVFAQLERGMISARMRAGRRLKAERGGYAGGRPPFGYRAEGRQLVPEPSEFPAIERATALRSDGASYRAIACILQSEGFVRKGGIERWHPVQVGRLLARAS